MAYPLRRAWQGVVQTKEAGTDTLTRVSAISDAAHLGIPHGSGGFLFPEGMSWSGREIHK